MTFAQRNGAISVALVKAAKVLFNEENFAILKELEGDLSSHVNRAAKLYIRSMQDKERGDLKSKEATEGN